MDEEFGKRSVFRKRIAHGALGVVIATGMSNLMGIFEGTTIAFLEFTAKYMAPLCIGDTVHLEMIPTEIIPGKKPGRGILKIDAKLINKEGTLILYSPWTIMMKSKPTS